MFKKIMLTILYTLLKTLFLLLCYAIALTLAIVSGYFTVRFYNAGTAGNDYYILTGLAVAFELVKLLLSIALPFTKGRSPGMETRIKVVIKIALIMSILASLNYLLIGKDFSLSPASKTVELLFYCHFYTLLKIFYYSYILYHITR